MKKTTTKKTYKYGFKTLKAVKERVKRLNYVYNYKKITMKKENGKIVFLVDGEEKHSVKQTGKSINMSKALSELLKIPNVCLNGKNISRREFVDVKKAVKKNQLHEITASIFDQFTQNVVTVLSVQ